MGVVKNILIAANVDEALCSSSTATLQAGKGIVGDRYYFAHGTFSKKLAGLPEVEVTLVEQEEIDAFNLKARLKYSGKDFRRNIVTEGVRLDDLVGEEFYIGAVKLKGIRLCEPCAYLAGKIGTSVLEYMMHKAGLRAQILESGRICISDAITCDMNLK